MGRSCAGRTKEGVPKRNNSGSAARQEQHLCTREQDRSGPRQPQLERDQLRLGAAAAASRRLLPRCRCRHHRRCAYHRTAAAAADAGWEPAAPPRRPQLPPATPCPCRQGHTPPRVAVATPPTAQVWARGARARWARRRWPWRHQAPASLPPPPPPPAPGTPGSRSTPPHRALPPTHGGGPSGTTARARRQARRLTGGARQRAWGQMEMRQGRRGQGGGWGEVEGDTRKG